MEESKCLLGWIVNTRSLSISLPWDKHKNWSNQVSSLISSKKASKQELEMLIRRLNHCALILPAMRNFLSRLRHALLQSTASNWSSLRLSEKSDLHLMKSYLDYAKEGVSMNTIVFRKPTHVYRSDSSKFGLEGYNITSGKLGVLNYP
jgi:hypothetical protein